MADPLEKNNLENQKWKKKVSQWMRYAELSICISLLSIVFLCFQITKTQSDLKSVTSQLLEVQSLVAAAKSSIGSINKELSSLQSLKDVITQKVDQFENDLTRFQTRNNTEGSHHKYFKDDYGMENKAIDMMSSLLHAKESIYLSGDFSLNSTRVDDKLFSRKLQAFEPCEGLSKFQVIINLDIDYNETSWKLIKKSSISDSNRTDDVIFDEKIIEQSSLYYVFTQCIEAGSYMFSIYDSFGDGISCGFGLACYTIHVDNDVIDGSRFSSEFSQTFSISPVDKSVCIGHHLQVQFDLDERFDGATWTLIKRPRTGIKGGRIDMSNDSFKFSTCVEPGYYHFRVVDSDGEEIFCDQADRTCIEVRVDNKLIEYIQVHLNMRQTFAISFEGNAITPKCVQRPILAPVNQLFEVEYNRIEGIMTLFTGLSSVKDLNDKNSPQYQAACFILYDDVLDLSIGDYAIMERYIMSVLLFSTGRHAFVELLSDNCAYRDVECNGKGDITKINWWSIGVRGVIPTEIAHLRFLESIRFNSNQLEGTIPTELGTLFYLKELRVNNNNIHGTIPTQIGRLNLLTDLRIGANDFSGSSIPSQIGNCGSLEYLGLTFSNLAGTIPPELFNARHLKFISMSHNRLTGTVPTTIGLLKEPKMMMMHDNKLHGTMPTEFGELSTLWNLRLEDNTLSGTLPSDLKQCRSLRELILRKNNFNGTIPEIFGNLSDLSLFDASDNINLGGEIPISLWENDFKTPTDVEQPEKGEAPVLADDRTMSVLSLRNTALTGTVPDEFCPLMDQLKLEYTNWFKDEPNIYCPCCEDFSHCYVWDLETNMTLSCPLHSVTLIESDNFFFDNIITVEDKISNQTLLFPVGPFSNTTLCLSPTGCYHVKANRDENFGYSSDSRALVDDDVCDSIIICGNEIHATHPKRAGLNHIMQVGVPNANILYEPESAHYKTLCWMMNEVNDAMPIDRLFHDNNICDGTLLQRFALGVFFYSQLEFFTIEFTADDYFKVLGNLKSCEWPGIKCDEKQVFVEEITVKHSNLTKFVRELGHFYRLKYLDLSDCNLQGTLDPATFANLPFLEHIDLSNNQLEGEIPEELLGIQSLKTLRLHNNQFEGTLPMNTAYSQALEEFNVGSNLLKGNIPEDIMKCPNFAYLDLSENYFDGDIPPTLGNLAKLKNITLSANLLTGSIPSELFAAKGLEVIMIQNNLLTGSIPAELGSLTNLTIVSMSHNKLKGNIPSNLAQLTTIQRLQLHQNQLKGRAPELEYLTRSGDKKAYITDCGQPNFALEEALECESCTMCCNSLRECQETQRRRISLNAAGSLFAVAFPLFAVLMAYVTMKLSRIYGRLSTFRVKETPYASDSVYHFIHSKKKLAKLLFFFTATLQVLLFFFYLAPSELNNENTDVQFSFRCPPSNNLDCIQVDQVGNIGWTMFGFVTMIYLGPDFVMSTMQIRKAVFIGDIPLLLGGVVVLALTSLAIFTSVVYNIALATNNTDLIMNAVILLFINDLDEKVLNILGYLYPEWTHEINDEVKNKMARIDSEFLTRQNGSRNLEIKG